ncbi:hypothetical protein BRI9_4387 [plant metagenome]|uniref:DUF202 domain-containing protein n=2 Tax=plant metagenome TaxID=1297885 RepID=A0A484UU45_9ZZZZ
MTTAATPMDPGLQPQRTALAWSRTAMTVGVNAALVLRVGVHGEEPLLTVFGIILLVAAAGLVLVAAWRKQALMRADAPGAPPAFMLQAVVAVCVLACVGGALTLGRLAGLA